VYARYSVEAYTKGIKIIDYSNLENYIEELIISLSVFEKNFVSDNLPLSDITRWS